MDKEKEQKAIERLKAFEPDDGYYLCYSGGKDSDCIRILADLAGVKHDIVNNHTTVDTPETVRYIRSIPNIKIDYPHYKDGTPKTMWNLIVKKMRPPTRLVRYCCSEFKERGGDGRLRVTGVRWAESPKRQEKTCVILVSGRPKTNQKLADELNVEHRITKQQGLVMNLDNDGSRRMVEQCYRTSTALINPIVDWTDEDVWDFLHAYGCESNPLYQCGFKRIGCIGCPMAGKHRYEEFKRYPKYRLNYIKAFNRMLLSMPKRPDMWKTGEEVFKLWMGENPDQIKLEGFEL